jgi:lysozyme
MNKDRLREEIAADEGVKLNSEGDHIIYLDHLSLPTCGVGHLITENDEEYDKPVGTVVEEERVRRLFALDIAVTIDECKVLYPDFDYFDEELQHILCNMMFNMGRPRLSRFKLMQAAIDNKDFNEAAEQMIDSRWHDQVPNRAKRLVKRMRALAS